MLRNIGYEVDVHVQSRYALEAFRESPQAYDAVITDQTMPRMTGLELAAAIHALRPDIPIVIATGFSDLINAESLEASGVCTVIPKPTTLYDLSRTLHSVFQAQRIARNSPADPENT